MSTVKNSSETYYSQSVDELLEHFNIDPDQGLKSSDLENR